MFFQFLKFLWRKNIFHTSRLDKYCKQGMFLIGFIRTANYSCMRRKNLRCISIRRNQTNIANKDCFLQVSFVQQLFVRVAKKSAVKSIRCELLNIANKECFLQVSFIQKVIRACGEKICGEIHMLRVFKYCKQRMFLIVFVS